MGELSQIAWWDAVLFSEGVGEVRGVTVSNFIGNFGDGQIGIEDVRAGQFQLILQVVSVGRSSEHFLESALQLIFIGLHRFGKFRQRWRISQLVHKNFLYSVDAFQVGRSEEHTSELQSRFDLVCRLLLEKKNYK